MRRTRANFRWQLMIAVLVVATTVISPQTTARAGEKTQTDCNPPTIWSEVRLDSFAVLYPPESAAFAQALLANFASYEQELEAAYRGFTQVFRVALTTPVTIRLYPRAQDYYCLNTLAPPLGNATTHSHIGTREIALIYENIPEAWNSGSQIETLNAFRYELATLFAEQLTGGLAPPGLLVGIGGYAENPNDVFAARYAATGLGNEPTRTWQALWDDQYLVESPADIFQATSIVAYLVDVYGWDDFAMFLARLSETEGYRQALSDVYGVGVQDLQKQWRDYFKVYVAGRWRVNVFHSFDLDVFEELIAGGAYADAADGLNEAIPVLTAFNQFEDRNRAEALLLKANQGVQAGALAAQARQSILEGKYEDGALLAQQSLALYEALGDTRRVAEVTAYLEVAEKVTGLRQEVERLGDQGGLGNPIALPRLYDLGKELGILGDQEGVSLVQFLMGQISRAQRVLIFVITAGASLLVGVLLLLRLWRLRKKRPVEADLL